MPPVVEGREEVANVQDAEDVVERAAVDRVARVRGVDERREALDGRKVNRESNDLGAGTITSCASLSAKSKTL